MSLVSSVSWLSARNQKQMEERSHLEVLGMDDYLMGGPGKAHRDSMERLRRRIMFAKWHRLLQDGPPFFVGRHFICLIEVSRLT